MQIECFLIGCRQLTTHKNIAKFAVSVYRTLVDGSLNVTHMRDGRTICTQPCAAPVVLVLANLSLRLSHCPLCTHRRLVLILRSSLVVDHVQDNLIVKTQATAFFYFDYQMPGSQRPGAFIASLLRQLVSQMPAFPECLRSFYGKRKNEEACEFPHDLSEILLETTTLFDSCYIIIDAIDECLNSSDRKTILHVLARLERPANKLFITSRPHCAPIFEAFEDVQTLAVEAREDDIRAYCDSAIDSSDVTPDLLDGNLRNQILDSIAAHAQGM